MHAACAIGAATIFIALAQAQTGRRCAVHAGRMNTPMRTFSGGSQMRGGIWLFVWTVLVLVASLGAALVLILLTPS